MTFDKENLKPLYQLVIGEAGESCAFYIAKRLGMPVEMLRRAARAAYGSMEGEKIQSSGKEECVEQGQSNDNRPDGVKRKSNEKYSGQWVPDSSLMQEQRECVAGERKCTKSTPHIIPKKAPAKKKEISFRRGDSVMVYPDKKIGIVCQEANEKGVLQVQLPGKKIWINHKRIKLQVAAEELYPEDYDFSIVFESVAARKLRHQMERKYVEGQELIVEE